MLLYYRYDMQALNVDFLELLARFLPTDWERQQISRYLKDEKPLDQLGAEDRFMVHLCSIPRLAERVDTMVFISSFADTVARLTPVSANYLLMHMKYTTTILLLGLGRNCSSKLVKLVGFGPHVPSDSSFVNKVPALPQMDTSGNFYGPFL